MENLLEIIGPLIVGALYILGSIVSKKNDAKDRPPAPRQRSRRQVGPEEADRQRQEQYEIRQEILERQSGRGTHSAPEETREEQPALIPIPVMQRQVAEQEDSSGFSWDEPEDSYEDEMERQLKNIEASRREAARLQSESTQGGVQSKGETGSSDKRRKKSSFGSVRSSLKAPAAARSAFIYGEVLGPPVSQRKSSGVPGLTS